MREIRIACPECGEECFTKIYDSINVTLEPELKTAVAEGTINLLSCPACGYSARIDMPFIYHDMERRVLISYAPNADATDIEDDALSEIAEDAGLFENAGYFLRRVDTYDELLEKLVIFGAGLDDRTVELCKLELLTELAEEKPELDIDHAVIDIKNGKPYVVFIDVDGDMFAIELPEDMPEQVESIFYDAIDLGTTGGFQRIDQQWAKELLDQGEL